MQNEVEDEDINKFELIRILHKIKLAFYYEFDNSNNSFKQQIQKFFQPKNELKNLYYYLKSITFNVFFILNI